MDKDESIGTIEIPGSLSIWEDDTLWGEGDFSRIRMKGSELESKIRKIGILHEDPKGDETIEYGFVLKGGGLIARAEKMNRLISHEGRRENIALTGAIINYIQFLEELRSENISRLITPLPYDILVATDRIIELLLKAQIMPVLYKMKTGEENHDYAGVPMRFYRENEEALGLRSDLNIPLYVTAMISAIEANERLGTLLDTGAVDGLTEEDCAEVSSIMQSEAFRMSLSRLLDEQLDGVDSDGSRGVKIRYSRGSVPIGIEKAEGMANLLD